MRHPGLAARALMAAAALLGACGGGARTAPADAHWAAMMVPHHQAGVALDDLALRRTDDVRVRQLAFQMNGYQGRELDELRRLAASAPAADYAGMAAGIPAAGELDGLGRLSGVDFDRTFLTLMIRHHEGAVAMSAPEADHAAAAVRRLADRVVTVQRHQLDQMRALLSELP